MLYNIIKKHFVTLQRFKDVLLEKVFNGKCVECRKDCLIKFCAMNRFTTKAAKIFRTVNYCIARSEVYLHEAGRR